MFRPPYGASVRDDGPDGCELVIGLVTPIGTNTGDLANSVRGALADWGYTSVLIKLSGLLDDVAGPPGETENGRVGRLIRAGNEFCRDHASDQHPEGDPAAMAKLAIVEIRRARTELHRLAGDRRTRAGRLAATPRPRTAYVLHSLKRKAEVEFLRELYGPQFLLLGAQLTVAHRRANLEKRALSEPGRSKAEIAQSLIDLDSSEDDPVGQRVNDTYPLADFFLSEADLGRFVGILFGAPEPPTAAEYAMYLARAASARSLSASRKVGAALVVDDTVVTTGFNDVPAGQKPDVLAGEDTSERFKRDNARDTLHRLQKAGLLANPLSDEGDRKAFAALAEGRIMEVIEYQRAVHAEARAMDECSRLPISPAGGKLYVTTFPCHLCYKQALSVRVAEIRYIEPYPKSRAIEMFDPGSGPLLLPYEGVAPRIFMRTFHERLAFRADVRGIFSPPDHRTARPRAPAKSLDEAE